MKHRVIWPLLLLLVVSADAAEKLQPRVEQVISKARAAYDQMDDYTVANDTYLFKLGGGGKP
jgi:hypothetical protein